MEKYLFCMAVLLIAIVILTLWTNIVVAVTKKVIAWDKFPTQVWVAVVAIASTIIAAAAAAQILCITMLWYHWVAAIAIGFLVCYTAMYGYDNLYKQIADTYQIIKEILKGISTKNK